MKNRFILYVYLLFSSGLCAQSLGGFSPKLQWKIIDEEEFQILFNPIAKPSAFQIREIIRQLHKDNNSMGKKRKNIPVVLRHQSTMPNGFVALTPFRSELNLTPHPNNFTLGTLDWNYLLSIHEYQHVLQFSNSLYGASKIGYYLGGELLWSGLLGLSIPNWFFEGEAVRAESFYSPQGRWRIPHFMNAIRQMAYDTSYYTYLKVRNGSFRDYVPDHYRLGSLMVLYGEKTHGSGFWQNVFKEASQYKSPFYPFGRALKRNSGLNTKAFYAAAFNDYRSTLTEQAKVNYNLAWPYETSEDLPAFSFLQVDEKTGHWYYIGSSNDSPPELIELTDTKHKAVLLQGFQIESYFDVYDNQYLAAAEYTHPRWGLETYHDLIRINLESQETERLTKGGRFFSPQWMKEGKAIIAVQLNENGQSELAQLDSNGHIVKTYANPKGYYFTYPKVLNEEELIVGLRNHEGQSCLARFKLNTEDLTLISDWTYHQIGVPFINGDWVYYSASYKDIDHIFRLNLKTESLEQVTYGRQAHYQPFINQETLYFKGFDLKHQVYYKQALTDIKAKKADELSTVPTAILPNLVSEPIPNPLIDKNDSTQLRNYHKGHHLFHLHSWTPEFADPLYQWNLYFEDVLGSFSSRLGLAYNSNEKGFRQNFNAAYGQYFTVFNLGGSLKERSRLDKSGERQFYQENEFRFGLSWPLNYSSGRYVRQVHFSSQLLFNETKNSEELNINKSILSTRTRQSFLIARRKALKNIFSPLAFSSTWKQSLGMNTSVAQLAFKNSFSIKGWARNHNLVMDMDWQWRFHPETYAYDDEFTVVRGYRSFFHENQNRLGLNYHFPIAYPDWGFGGLFYVFRLRGNSFFDLGEFKVNSTQLTFASAGAELIIDLNLLNAFYTSIGVRYAHLLRYAQLSQNGQANVVEVFIPLNRF